MQYGENQTTSEHASFSCITNIRVFIYKANKFYRKIVCIFFLISKNVYRNSELKQWSDIRSNHLAETVARSRR